MLTKYHSDVDSQTLLNYSLMFTGLKKNGDVKVRPTTRIMLLTVVSLLPCQKFTSWLPDSCMNQHMY